MPPATSSSTIYLYGMIVLSSVHRLGGSFPEADGYGEIEETHVVPGGETGNAALVLAAWGHRVKVAGPFLGLHTREGVLGFLEARGIDCSGLHYDPSYGGVRDLVLVGGAARAVFGWFGAYFRGPRRWQAPARADIEASAVVGLDPFFGGESEQVAGLCRELGRPFVTIDCEPGGALHRAAAATVVSGEYLRAHHPGADRAELLRAYAAQGPGLTVFTQGSGEILHLRGRGAIGRVTPFPVVPRCTLGAGDTFRAGVIHGVLRGWDDGRIVRFAAATAACACQRFPMAHNPPSLAEVGALAEGGTAAS